MVAKKERLGEGMEWEVGVGKYETVLLRHQHQAEAGGGVRSRERGKLCV